MYRNSFIALLLLFGSTSWSQAQQPPQAYPQSQPPIVQPPPAYPQSQPPIVTPSQAWMPNVQYGAGANLQGTWYAQGYPSAAWNVQFTNQAGQQVYGRVYWYGNGTYWSR
jgi:hypothetical protein